MQFPEPEPAHAVQCTSCLSCSTYSALRRVLIYNKLFTKDFCRISTSGLSYRPPRPPLSRFTHTYNFLSHYRPAINSWSLSSTAFQLVPYRTANANPPEEIHLPATGPHRNLNIQTCFAKKRIAHKGGKEAKEREREREREGERANGLNKEQQPWPSHQHITSLCPVRQTPTQPKMNSIDLHLKPVNFLQQSLFNVAGKICIVTGAGSGKLN